MHTSTGKYTEIITERLVISGFEIEQYQYKEKPVIRNYKRRKRKEKNNGDNQNKQIKKTDFAINRTRREIRRLVNSNNNLMKFLTLTTKITGIKKANRFFNLFTQRMKNRFPEFQYLAVIEFQSDIDFFGIVKPDGGAVHYHLLCNLRYVKSEEISKIWKHGFIKIKRVSHVDNLGRYLSKYLQKDMFDERMFGKKKFFCSQDLKRPTEITNSEAQFFVRNNSENLKITWEATFKDDYRGEILYKIFHLKNRQFLPVSNNSSIL